MQPYLALLRPAQWTKNAFLFAALIFSRHLFDSAYATRSVRAFAAFCMAASAVYILNDLNDADADRLHPTKRNRPLVTGSVSQSGAVAALVLLAAGAALVGATLPGEFIGALLAYVLVNVAYTYGLKQVVLVDVFVIATGFLIRVVAGAYAIGVEVSHWLILCTMFIALFLAVSKRRAELLLNQLTVSESGRSVLKHYDVQFVDQLMTVVASGTIISYALYSVADRTVMMFGTENLVFTTVFVLFGTFRYLYLIRSHSTQDNPTALLLSDIPLMATIACWLLACVWIVYNGTSAP